MLLSKKVNATISIRAKPAVKGNIIIPKTINNIPTTLQIILHAFLQLSLFIISSIPTHTCPIFHNI